MCGKRLKYIRSGSIMFKLAQKFDKRLEYVGNDISMWEMA